MATCCEQFSPDVVTVPDVQDQCSPDGATVTEEDLQDLHEDILDRNEDGVREILGDFQGQESALRVLCSTEVLLEPAAHDHPLNRLPLSAVHRAALSASHGVLDVLLAAAPTVSIDHALAGSRYTVLHLAAAGGILAAVNYLTTSGASLSARDVTGRTPAHLAANKDVLSLLSVRGADINAKDNMKRSPLHAAAEDGRVDCVDFLVSKNADVTAKDAEGRTPLHVAQIAGYEEISARLIERAPDLVNDQDQNGNTPLHTWFQHLSSKTRGCSLSSFLVLLKSGFDVNIKNKDGNTLLHLATSNGCYKLLEALLEKGAEVDSTNNAGRSPLFYAQSEDICEFLILHGATCDLQDCDSNNVLHVYAKNNDVTCEMLNFVTDNGAAINLINANGDTPLHCACSVGNIEKVITLLNLGAPKDIKNSKGHSILHVALLNAQTSLVLHLLNQNSIDITQQNSAGDTLLHLAAAIGSEEVVQHLLRGRVDVNRINLARQTATTVAAAHCHYYVLAMLLRRSGAIDTKLGAQVLLHYVLEDDLETVNLLLNQVDCNMSKTKDGQSALHLALSLDKTNMSCLLLEHGADLQCRDAVGQTPLHAACRRLAVMEPMLPQLIIRENCSMQDTTGSTALHYGITECTHYTLENFLHNGFDINSKDNDGRTVLDVLLESGRISIVESLYQKLELVLQSESFSCDSAWKPLLHSGVLTKDPIVVEQLLSVGVAIDVTNEASQTPLHCACAIPSPQIVSLLLQQKADVDALDKNGLTPIVYAIKSKDDTIIKQLVNHGADLNVQDRCFGKTCLMFAMENKLKDICVDIILGGSVNLDLQDKDGQYIWHYATQFCNNEVLDALIDLEVDLNAKDGSGSSSIHKASLNEDPAVMALLLSRGVDKNTQNHDGDTALHICSLHGSYDHVKNLLDRDADMELANLRGEAAVHLAAQSADPDVMQLLIANEVDVDVTDQAGNSPLMTGILCGNLEVASLLLEQGADASTQNQHGDTALHIAMKKNRLDKAFLKYLVHRSRRSMGLKNADGLMVLDLLRERTDIEDLETFSREIGLDL